MNQTEANKALIRAHCDAIAKPGKAGAVARQVAAEFVGHGEPAIAGPEGIQAEVACLRAAFPDLNLTIEDMVAERDLVAARLTWSGTHRGSYRGVPPIGRSISVTAMTFWRVSGGQIRERWGLIDTPALLRQLQGE